MTRAMALDGSLNGVKRPQKLRLIYPLCDPAKDIDFSHPLAGL